jgi:hypothetical protein
LLSVQLRSDQTPWYRTIVDNSHTEIECSAIVDSDCGIHRAFIEIPEALGMILDVFVLLHTICNLKLLAHMHME